MKRILTGFSVTLVAAIWMTGSWLFCNSIAVGANGSSTPAVADSKSGPIEKPAAESECGKHGKHWKHRHKMHRLWKKLNLSEAQKKEVHAILDEELAKMKPMLEQLKAGREQFNALLKSGPFDEAKIRSVAKAQADTLLEMIVVREHMKSRIYAVLTPEQRTRAEELLKSWQARYGKEHEQED